MATQPAATPTEPAAPAAPDPMAALESEVGEIFGVTEAPESAAPAPAEATPAAAPAPTAKPEGGVDAPSSPSEPAPAAAPAPQPAAQPSGLEPAPAPSPAAPAAPGQPDPTALELASLRAQVVDLTTRLAQPQPAPAQPGGQSGQPGSSPEEEAPPQYGFVIPDQIGAAILSDDPQQNMQGITALLNGLAARVHQNIRLETAGRLTALRTEMAQAIQAPQEAARREAMQAEYYTDFPQHKNPVIQSILSAEAQALALQFPGAPWDANYRATLGARVNAKIAELTGAAPAPAVPAPVPAPVPVPAARPAAFTPTTPRTDGAMPNFGSETEAQVAEVFSFPT